VAWGEAAPDAAALDAAALAVLVPDVLLEVAPPGVALPVAVGAAGPVPPG